MNGAGSSWQGEYIAVDWGTTNRRAYRMSAARALLDEFEDDEGLMSVPAGGFEAAAVEIRARLGDLPMLLAGMVGSNRGWREAAYVPCPAGAEDLAAALTWVEPGRTAIVPGVCQRGAAGADVMRGEEVQVLGAVAAGLVPRDVTICHPGTHAKWIRMESGRIAAFRTMMTGELFGLLRKHSILADRLVSDDEDEEAFRRGAREALAGGELLSSLFGIRARALLGEERGSAGAYASGLLIGTDVRAGLGLYGDRNVVLIGRPELCMRYAWALDEAKVATNEVDGAEAFLAGMNLLTERI